MSEQDEQGPMRSDAPAEEGNDTFESVDFDLLPGGLKGAIEAVLMVIEEPVSVLDLATALEVPTATVEAAVADLSQEYAAQNRGFVLRHVSAGWRIYSRPEFAAVVGRFIMNGRTAKLTQASLETLAVVAYRQPVSRSRVSAVRGVNVDGVIRTLTTRRLIEEVDTDAETGATLYGTTNYFLERLGLQSLDDLPALAPFLPELDALDEIAQGDRP